MDSCSAGEVAQPYCIALSGGIASGKSYVTAQFAALGAFIIDTDVLAREAVEPGTEGLRLTVCRFGDAVLNEDGSLNRTALRQSVFEDPAARKDLEDIVHPRIRALAMRSLQTASGPYTVLVVPLLAEHFESYRWVDRVLIVDCKRATQLSRLIKRDGISEQLANAMLDSQSDRQSRLDIASDVITNEGMLAEIPGKVASLHAKYLDLAGHRQVPILRD